MVQLGSGEVSSVHRRSGEAMRRQPQITGLASSELTHIARSIRGEDGVLLRVTFGGNLYAFSVGLLPMIRFCRAIGKSRKAIRRRDDYRVWFVRMRSRAHKIAAYDWRAGGRR